MSDVSAVDDGELVPGPSAAQFDVWGRFAWLAFAVVLVVAIALTSIPLAILAVVAIIAAFALGARSARVTRRERDLGYSTVFDFPGFA